MNKAILIFILTYVLCQSSVAQEVLLELQVNPQLASGENNNNSPSASFKTNHTANFFLLDTLSLPFIDDFSTNLLKSYDTADYPGILVFDSVAYDFIVNGFYKDTLQYSADTTWSYIYDTSTSISDSTVLTQLEVVYFNDANNPFIPTDTLYFWPPYNTYDTLPPAPPVDTIFLPAPITSFNQIDTIKVYPPDSVSLWIDNYAFINSTYPIDPVTIGVATLDGVDDHGRPYDFSMPQTYGVADYLTSKPINLDTLLPADSIYLSFFYQPQGRGNDPQPEDSLVLEFYSPSQAQWFNIWSVAGSANQNFKQVMIPVTDVIYLEKGFQFRLKNYATLSGNLDHWHIDYVRLNKARSIDDTVIVDVAFVYNTASLLKNYQAMPWKHFLLNPTAAQMVSSMVVVASNNDTVTKNVNYKYQIKGDTMFEFAPGSNNIFPYSDIGYHTYTSPLNYVFYYPALTDSAVFEIINIVNTTPDNNRLNDTIRYYQRFYNYYAYDDGTAEAGYGLNEIGAQLAYRFTLDQPDTMRAVQMYFNQQLNDVSQELFYLTVWDEAGGQPGNIVYQKAGVKPVYEDSLNKFHTYLIDSVLVMSNTFYLGWVQATAEILNIGFDKNINSNTNMFYNVTGSWQNSIIPGSWMIRPVFGDTVIISAGVPPKTETGKNFNFNIYPNPTTGKVAVAAAGGSIHTIEIYNVLGEKVTQSVIPNGVRYLTIDVSNLPEGIYMILITDLDNNNSSAGKILIAR